LPEPATVFEAFRWSVVRRVAKTATVEFEANRYQVDPALVGRHVELRFDPEDLTCIDVYCEGVACGAAVPVVIGRHVHPAVPQANPEASSPSPTEPGIDYLGLVQAVHEEATYGPIAYRDIPVSGEEGEAPCPPPGHDPEGHDGDEDVL
jgi:putative transposase